MSTLTASQIFNLTAQEVSALSIDELLSMTREQLYKPYGIPSDLSTNWWYSSWNNYGLGANAAGLTVPQVQALGTRISFLGREAIAALSLDAIRSLTTSQIQALTRDQIGEGIRNTSWQDYHWDTPDIPRGLTATQIAALSTEQFAALSANGISGFTATQIAAFSATQFVVLIAKLTANQIFNLTAQQVSTIPIDVLVNMTREQLYKPYGVPSDWFDRSSWYSSWNNYGLGANAAGLTVPQVQALGTRISFLGREAIAALSVDVIRSLTVDQIQALTEDQIGEGVKRTSPYGFWGWDTPDVPRGFTVTQTAAFSTSQTAAFSNLQISAITPQAISGLSAAVISALTEDQLRYTPARIEYRREWITVWTGGYGSYRLSDVPYNIPASGFLDGAAGLTGVQIIALGSHITFLHDMAMPRLSLDAIRHLSAEQVGVLRISQLKSLNSTQYETLLSSNSVSGLTATQIRSFSPSQISAMTPKTISRLSAAAISALTIEQLSYTPAHVESRLEYSQFYRGWLYFSYNIPASGFLEGAAGFTRGQIIALGLHITFLHDMAIPLLSLEAISGLFAAQVKVMRAAQVAALKVTQMGALTADGVSGLTPAHIGILTVEQIEGLSANGVSGFTPAHIKLLTVEKIGALSANGVSGFTPAQIRILTTEQIGGLSANGVSGFTKTQIVELSTMQIAALSANGVSGFTATQIKFLSFAQIAALNATQIATISNEVFSTLTNILIGRIDYENVMYSNRASDALQKYWFTNNVLGHELKGTNGSDSLYMPSSGDIRMLSGGLGADFLMGGEKNDTYRFDLNTYFGGDRIFDMGSSIKLGSSKDSILLDGSIIGTDPNTNAEQNQYNLLFTRSGVDDLLITDLEKGRSTSYAPSILVSHQFLSLNKIEAIHILTKNGKYTSISAAGIDNLVQAMAGINYSTATSASLSSDPIKAAINANWKTNSFLG